MRFLFGIMLPFLGTALGAAAVYCMPRMRSARVHGALAGFAAGVMTAASVWSLLIPAIEQSGGLGAFSFVPAAVGFWAGCLLLLGLDRWSERIAAEDFSGVDGGTKKMLLAIVIHNIPEGIAVGVGFAGALAGSPGISLAAAMALSFGIAVQNLPEGAIVSMPLHASGISRTRACLLGALSGAVEPLGAALTLLCARIMTPVLPYLLSFAAGAMLIVVAQELCPAIAKDKSGRAALLFSLGFTLMMALDVALG